ncbi:LysR family transcriptional regulator [Photobacterium alginatilyticum]|uniref:LysR family transcriptional regulator n=1 Tax=Photobacterium alginatilyticum TaxID=1775171 RepID=A0ABW9YDU8_9GAMM|nr:LysR family transcriptional regulator [Photobacterium alginatilyticum]NBI51812.1 LysR family transcriptional regulator [Photobacterium alginatilyticum]
MDKIRALRYFKRVAELNSFTLAAQEFDVPPSSISRRIKDLESELGVELIKRTTRNVSTTELGSVYYRSIVEALQKIDDADELVSQRLGEMSGKLRISSTASYGEKVLFPVLQKFRQKYPSIILDLDYSDERVVFSKDAVDIAIRAGHVPEERVIAKHLSSARFILVATPQLLHSLQKRFHRKTLTVADIESSPSLQYRGNQGVFSWWTFNGDAWEKIAINPILLCNNGESLLAAALAHEGLLLYPHWWVSDYLASGELVEVPVNSPVSSRQHTNLDIFVLYQQAKYQIPKIKHCVDFILQHLK